MASWYGTWSTFCGLVANCGSMDAAAERLDGHWNLGRWYRDDYGYRQRLDVDRDLDARRRQRFHQLQDAAQCESVQR